MSRARQRSKDAARGSSDFVPAWVRRNDIPVYGQRLPLIQAFDSQAEASAALSRPANAHRRRLYKGDEVTASDYTPAAAPAGLLLNVPQLARMRRGSLYRT
jgi:hypothetical protein